MPSEDAAGQHVTTSPSHQAIRTCLFLFLLSQLLFMPRIAWPPGFAFDEVFYVPAARGFLHWTLNLNRVHPPLGKYLIALGMALWGDNMLGWRFAGSIFGGLTLAGLYAWALAVFRQHRLALWAALVALTDRKSTRLNSSHIQKSRMPSSA